MRWRVSLTVVLAWILTVPLSLANAEQTLQQRYLDIYLKINDAEHLEKQGDFRGALDDFKDCYDKLAKIHDSDPNWETALVVHRMEDCKAKILDLQPKADAQPPAAPEPQSPMDNNYNPPPPPGAEVNPDSDDVAALKLQLQAVKQELEITKQNLRDSQAQLETYRTQLETVNAQLAAVKNQQSVDDRMGKLLSDNKALTDKLAAAEKELDEFKSNPQSKLAIAEAQLKNLQDQYDASQEANKALQDTTTTLKQQLDQANADLVAANQRLAEAGPGSPEYETLKRENEIMRDILTRELQEQAHRDMAKRLAQEEFDNLKLKSKVLQEQLDILGSPMTPPTNDQERALLASLKVPGPDVTQPTTENGFSAPVSGTTPSTDQATTNPPATPAPSSPDTNTASATPPDTNTASVTPPAANSVTGTTPSVPATDNSTNEPPVNIVMNNQTPASGDATPPSATNTPPDASTSATNAPSSVTPPPVPSGTPDTATPPTAPAPTNAPDTNAPIPPNTPTGQPASDTNTVTPPAPAAPPAQPEQTTPTTTSIPPGTTTYTDTTINNGANAPQQNDPTQYSTRARLPDDMRETAQDAADLFKNQKYDESAAKYQSIIDKYPESLYAWSNLGVVRFQQGKYDEALRALQQAVKLSPTDAFSYSNLGIVYYQLNQYENAIDALNSAKALDPNDAKTHNYLGCACSQKGWQEVAEKEFRQAIEIDPNFGDAHFNLALVYATSKPPSLELARREYNRALELGIARDARLEKLLQGPQ
jgi:Flp pilus assembly protein TadD